MTENSLCTQLFKSVPQLADPEPYMTAVVVAAASAVEVDSFIIAEEVVVIASCIITEVVVFAS